MDRLLHLGLRVRLVDLRVKVTLQRLGFLVRLYFRKAAVSVGVGERVEVLLF